MLEFACLAAYASLEKTNPDHARFGHCWQVDDKQSSSKERGKHAL